MAGGARRADGRDIHRVRRNILDPAPQAPARRDQHNNLLAGRELFQSETLHSLSFSLLAVDTIDVLAGLVFMEKYSLNSSDAAILAVFLRYATLVNEPCVVVAADSRLVRAATAEGLRALNPELVSAPGATAFLTTL